MDFFLHHPVNVFLPGKLQNTFKNIFLSYPHTESCEKMIYCDKIGLMKVIIIKFSLSVLKSFFLSNYLFEKLIFLSIAPSGKRRESFSFLCYKYISLNQFFFVIILIIFQSLLCCVKLQKGIIPQLLLQPV